MHLSSVFQFFDYWKHPESWSSSSNFQHHDVCKTVVPKSFWYLHFSFEPGPERCFCSCWKQANQIWRRFLWGKLGVHMYTQKKCKNSSELKVYSGLLGARTVAKTRVWFSVLNVLSFCSLLTLCPSIVKCIEFYIALLEIFICRNCL